MLDFSKSLEFQHDHSTLQPADKNLCAGYNFRVRDGDLQREPSARTFGQLLPASSRSAIVTSVLADLSAYASIEHSALLLREMLLEPLALPTDSQHEFKSTVKSKIWFTSLLTKFS